MNGRVRRRKRDIIRYNVNIIAQSTTAHRVTGQGNRNMR